VPNPNMYGPASLALSQTIVTFTSFLPHLSDVRKASPNDPDIAGDVRLGEIAAATLAIGVGCITSSVVGNATPTVVSAIMAVALICIYESALRNTRPMDPIKQTVKVEDDGSVTVH
jgi:hypothetical protein